jgi:hypothetical protein
MSPKAYHAVDRRSVAGRVREIGPEPPREAIIRHVNIIPDWAILVLAVLAVAGVFKLFGGFGVLVLGIAATAVWIAQIARMHQSWRARRIVPVASAIGHEGRHAAP